MTSTYFPLDAVRTFWDDPRWVAVVAAVAASLLVSTVWLIRRRSRNGRSAAIVCLVASVALHGALLLVLPKWHRAGGGLSRQVDGDDSGGLSQVMLSHFDAMDVPSDVSGTSDALRATVSPLPLPPVTVPSAEANTDREEPRTSAVKPREPDEPADAVDDVPTSLRAAAPAESIEPSASIEIEQLLSQWLIDDAEAASGSSPAETVAVIDRSSDPITEASPAWVPGYVEHDFANRSGPSKRLALLRTGGDESTEAAVAKALAFLVADQRPDGAWDPLTSGAGRETFTLGTDRGSAGKRSTTGITGLALLALLGAGQTHHTGEHAESVRRGLVYLIRAQAPDGSLAGAATVYEANYCHGMAALAICEAAAMTGDAAAVRSAEAAIRYTLAQQHPTTGGWRYTRGDPGDLSQLGWQAMVLESGRAAGIEVDRRGTDGCARFLRSVRSGQRGGLASYRPGEAPSRTMTAEALASRLLLGESVPADEIAEAETYLLRQPPGVGRDNYYGWYYTSLALHQLQDNAWRSWNEALKSHLLSRQLPEGSWPTDSEWGGYGGRVYTTATAALCLEVYYRHISRATLAP